MFDMMGNYEQRKVARWPDVEDKWIVDTCAVTDSDKPYETAVQHDKYNDGEMVIVEMYASKEEAQTGHDRWVKIMSTRPLPEKLQDVGTSLIGRLARMLESKGATNA